MIAPAIEHVEAVMSRTDNASSTATQREQRLVELRREAVQRCVSMLVGDSGPGMAAAVLIASVLGSQARTAGIRLPSSEIVR